MLFYKFRLQFISIFVLIRIRACFICCVELIDCKMTCVLSMLKNVIFSASLLMYHQHQLILIFIKHLDSFEGLMAIIIFTALARIDVRRHNIVSRFISNLSSLLPWSMMGRSCVLLSNETFKMKLSVFHELCENILWHNTTS